MNEATHLNGNIDRHHESEEVEFSDAEYLEFLETIASKHWEEVCCETCGQVRSIEITSPRWIRKSIELAEVVGDIYV